MKQTVGVVFGGRSGEHEVSLVSATSVVQALDPSKYQVVEIGISVSGQWYTGPNCLDKFKKQDFEGLSEVNLKTDPEKPGIIVNGEDIRIDVYFPVLHGPFGEDGTIQGLFEMLQVPYVGDGVLASSTGMDKLQCKAIWESAGLPVVPYIGFTRKAWKEEREKILHDIREKFDFPVFVKPANMGSSVGVSKAKNNDDLIDAVDLAAKYDHRILVEEGLDVREIECAIIGNHDPMASPVGEVIVGGEFYDFFDKYIDGKSSTEVPANIDEKLAEEIKEMCVKAYKLLDCSGLARMDSFVDRKSGKIYLNEINTMPGFTSISMYPKMMEAAGIDYQTLVDQLIAFGIDRFKERQGNQVVFSSESDWFKN